MFGLSDNRRLVRQGNIYERGVRGRLLKTENNKDAKCLWIREEVLAIMACINAEITDVGHLASETAELIFELEYDKKEGRCSRDYLQEILQEENKNTV